MDRLRDNLPANLETDEITELPGEAALLLAEEAVNKTRQMSSFLPDLTGMVTCGTRGLPAAKLLRRALHAVPRSPRLLRGRLPGAPPRRRRGR